VLGGTDPGGRRCRRGLPAAGRGRGRRPRAGAGGTHGGAGPGAATQLVPAAAGGRRPPRAGSVPGGLARPPLPGRRAGGAGSPWVHSRDRVTHMANVIDIGGIGAVYSRRLREAGVATTEALLAEGATPRGRKELADKTGIAPGRILHWVNRADLFRIPGVG